MSSPSVLVVDAILFDSDGVLVDSHEQVDAAWEAVADEYGLDWEIVRSQLRGVPARDTLARHLSGAELDEAVSRLEDLEVGSADTTPPVPGAVELTAALPPDAFAIATSASRRLGLARWAGAGITVPTTIVTADDVRRGKPDPEPFLTAARRLGVDPRRCVVFEDSDAGGTAAREAGAAVVAVGSVEWTSEPPLRIADLRHVAVSPGPDGSWSLSFGG